MAYATLLCVTVKALIYEGRPTGMNPVKDEVAKYTNKNRIEGSLADVVQGADVFIGVSAEGALTEEMVRTMNDDAIIFAMANPVPEIMPELAKAAGAAVVEQVVLTSQNQVNNVLAFLVFSAVHLTYMRHKLTKK